MVPETPIPPHVLRFVEVNIDTVPQLETLLMMSEAAFLFLANPNAGDEAIYVVRLLSCLLILAAIANKNRK